MLILLIYRFWPDFNYIGSLVALLPVLISGPLVSRRIETWAYGLVFKAYWTPTICMRCYSWSPWLKFNLATLMPSSINLPAFSGDSVLGLNKSACTRWCRQSWFFSSVWGPRSGGRLGSSIERRWWSWKWTCRFCAWAAARCFLYLIAYLIIYFAWKYLAQIRY